MSVYSQSLYGQQSYTAPAFHPPSSNIGYPYQFHHQPTQATPPPPPVFHHVDPVTFRRDYIQRLSQLTFNSRPIIQSLSMLAQDYSRFADIVAQCLEAHIRGVAPWMKLPAFYLLDAISKNVYEPYARHFASFVIPLFLETYNQVDANTRSKMEEMLLTWRTGSPTGKELFGVPAQIAIERGVWSGDSVSTHQSTDGYNGSGHITRAQVLSELQYTLGQKERYLQSNPYDTYSQNHIAVLHQLRKLVEAGVSQEELQQILTQLRSLARSSVPSVSIPSVTAPTSVQWPPVTMPPQSTVDTTLHTYPQLEISNFNPESLNKMEGMSSNIEPSVSSSTSTISAPPHPNIANLLSTLLKAGVVSASGTPLGAGMNTNEKEPKETEVDMRQEAIIEYRTLILGEKVSLTSSEITRTRPHITELLYKRLNAQCKQCGIRFSDSTLGKSDLEDHLDMHFRQNRKASQNTGRGHSRSWFVGIEDWIQDLSEDRKGKGRADTRLNSKVSAAAENAKREAELRAQYVVVPPGDEAKAVACPVCKETLKSEFLEDDEDWVWKNAVMKDDRVYHATCHAEAVLSTNSLAARLRTEMANSSRPNTPETVLGSVARSTPPPSKLRVSESPFASPSQDSKITGTKRKGDFNADASANTDGTPPLKKLALSAS